MPKILKMPKPVEERRSPKDNPASTPSEPREVVSLHRESEADLDRLNRWVNLGDQVLGNIRKKA